MDRFECKHGVNLKYICDCQQKEQEKVLQETLPGGRSGLTAGSSPRGQIEAMADLWISFGQEHDTFLMCCQSIAERIKEKEL